MEEALDLLFDRLLMMMMMMMIYTYIYIRKNVYIYVFILFFCYILICLFFYLVTYIFCIRLIHARSNILKYTRLLNNMKAFLIDNLHIRYVHVDIIKVLFIHQLMH